MTKKVLIIAYHFPPRPSVASLRIQGLAKYLPEYGWEPTIITAKLPGKPDPRYHVIETQDSDILLEWKRRFGLSADKTFREQLGQTGKNDTIVDLLLQFAKEILAYPDYNKKWYSYVMPTARELLKTGEYEAILSSAGPYTSHIIAHDLKKEFGIPWIADFRDLWTQNQSYSYNSVRKFFESRLEISTLNNADAITTVSEPLAQKLRRLHHTPVYVITNGFDPEILNTSIPMTKKFTITYTGRIYRNVMNLEPLFRTIQKFLQNRVMDPSDIEINFWGSFEPWLKDMVLRYQLDHIVLIHNYVPRQEIIKIQRESQILLLLTWNDPDEQGILTGKIFEYLAARRPILAIGYAKGGIYEMLEDTRGGYIAETDIELESVLLDMYLKFKENGAVAYTGVNEKVQKYGHDEMARKFAELGDTVSCTQHS